MTNSKSIGRYELKKELGQGGMATVFLARDPRFDREVALKVMPPTLLHDPTFRLRFEREAKMIASLEHKAIVPVYDYGEHQGQPFLVMRYMGGGSLLDRLQTGPMALQRTVQIIGRIAAALDKAHIEGIVHRDLKPGNILFDTSGDAYLSDFGIAKMLEGEASLTGAGVIGTPQYMSPEQAKGQGNIDGRSDIYNLGAILFEMLSGNLPFHAETPVGLIMKHLSEPVPRIRSINPDLPQEVERIINRAMAKDRDQRYQKAGQMAADLNKVQSTKPGSAARAGNETVLERWDSQAAAPPSQGAASPPVQGSAAADATVLERYVPPTAAVEKEVAAAAVSQPAPKTPPAAPPKKRRRFPLWLLAIVGIAVIGLILFGSQFLLPGAGETSSTSPAAVTVDSAPVSYGIFDEQCADIPDPVEAQIMLRFINDSSFESIGFWENNAQSPVEYVEYFRIPDGGSYLQETQIGHKWVIQEPSGATLSEYRASNQHKQCVLLNRPLGTLWLEVINQNNGPVIGYLVAAGGTEEPQFIVNGGAEIGLWTSAGNVWRLKDAAGNNLLEYTATSAAEQQLDIQP